MDKDLTSRRAVLMMGAAGAAGALAGCQVYGRPDPPPPPPPPPSVAGSDGGQATPEVGGNGEEPPPAGAPVASAGEVPVGGGLIVADQELVITQPSEGQFAGFSAICTHQGCTVDAVADGTINCPCHGSRFSIVDGSVVRAASTLPGGATQDPLPQVALVVEGDTIALPG
jgi:Rieske Fe-S protein